MKDLARTVAVPAALFGLMGLSAEMVLLPYLLVDPNQMILSRDYWEAWQPFYSLGSDVVSLSRLALTSALLALLTFLYWSGRTLGLPALAREAPSGGRLLRGALGATMLAAVAFTVLRGLAPEWLVSWVALPVALLALGLAGRRWRLGLAAAGTVLAGEWLSLHTHPLRLLASVAEEPYWLELGVWRSMALMGAMGAAGGAATGLALFALAEGEGPRWRRVAVSLVLGAGLAWAALALAPAPPGLDLPRGAHGGRTVAWLDEPREPFVTCPGPTRLTPAGLQALAERLEARAALDVPAATAALGNRALWDWKPRSALAWVWLQHRDLLEDVLPDTILVAALRTTMPDSRGAWYLDRLVDGREFAWPGALSRLAVARLLHRYGRDAEARRWAEEAGEPPEVLREQAAVMRADLERPAPSGTVRGRLLLDGRPLAGAPVRLFRDRDGDAVRAARDAVHGEARTMEPGQETRSGQFLAGVRLQYAVVETDADGWFRFEPVDEGRYLLGVRLEGERDVRVEAGTGLVDVRGARDADLGTLRLVTAE